MTSGGDVWLESYSEALDEFPIDGTVDAQLRADVKKWAEVIEKAGIEKH